MKKIDQIKLIKEMNLWEYVVYQVDLIIPKNVKISCA